MYHHYTAGPGGRKEGGERKTGKNRAGSADFGFPPGILPVFRVQKISSTTLVGGASTISGCWNI